MQWHDVTRKIFGGPLGGQAKFWGAVAPWHPPSSAPGYHSLLETPLDLEALGLSLYSL